MRIWKGLLALLLTAGVGLVPAQVRGQDMAPADPVFPLPLYHDRPEKGGLYTSAEFVFFQQTNPLKHQEIAVRGISDTDGSIGAALNGTLVQTTGGPIIIPGATTVGQFYGSGKGALFADDASGGSGFEPGMRFSVGWKFENGTTVDLRYFTLAETKYSAVATLVPAGNNAGPQLLDSFLYSPVYNFPIDFAGPANKLAIGNPNAAYGIWDGANLMDISFVQRFTQYDITVRTPIWEYECNKLYALVGPRHVDMWERFFWRTVAQNFDGTGDPTGVALYSNVTSNQMYGVFAGLGGDLYLGKGFSVSLDCRAAAMVDFVREIAKYERGDLAIANKRANRDYTIVPEVEGGLYLHWYPIEGIECKLGYELMNFFNTMSSPDPVDFNYGGLDPGWKRQYRFFDGWNMGVAFVF